MATIERGPGLAAAFGRLDLESPGSSAVGASFSRSGSFSSSRPPRAPISPTLSASPPVGAAYMPVYNLNDLPTGLLEHIFLVASMGSPTTSAIETGDDGLSQSDVDDELVAGLGAIVRSVRGGGSVRGGRRGGGTDVDDGDDDLLDASGGPEVLWSIYNVCIQWRAVAMCSPVLRPAWRHAVLARPKELVPPSWWAAAPLDLIRAAVDEASFQELLQGSELPAGLPWGEWANDRFLPSLCRPEGPYQQGRNLYLSSLARHERVLDDMCSGHLPVSVVVVTADGRLEERSSSLYARHVRRSVPRGRAGQGRGLGEVSSAQSEAGTSHTSGGRGQSGFISWLGGEGSGIWEQALQMVGSGEQPGFLNRLVEDGPFGRFKDVFSTWDAAGDTSVGTRCVEIRWDNVWRDLWAPASTLEQVLEDTRVSLLQHWSPSMEHLEPGRPLVHFVAKIRRLGRTTVYAFFCVDISGGVGDAGGGWIQQPINARAMRELRLREWAGWMDTADLENPGFQAARAAFARGDVRGRAVLFATCYCPRRRQEVVVPYTNEDHATLFEGDKTEVGWTWAAAEWDTGWWFHM